ncbi:FxsA family protein [Pararhodospirillum oryzae]|uniref:Membrane protein n=1 Tax=Pararhodospirillum oryzae TaxID=478448 RepID=A0A512H600_9PROT|nr:FxsA family protein [Pararhodospirillum oryzae]GEO80873.1 membrane protein [Pararhodospirillum oryzae]
MGLPFAVLLALFIGFPVIEIALFIKVGGAIGVVPTLALVVLAAVAGSAVVRHQGLSTLNKAQEAVNAGILPVKELFDGVCILIAGFLLVLPGFFSDILAVLLLIAPVRDALRGWLDRHPGMVVTPMGARAASNEDGARGPQVIDAEYVEVTVDVEGETTTSGSPSSKGNPWGKGGAGQPPADG